MTRSGFSFAEACTDPHLFGPWFTGDSWARWRVVDKALFGERLDPAEAATFKELTGRDDTPDKPATEAWLIVGRRGGKDVKAAAIAVYLATIGAELFGWRQRLARGEKGVVQVLAVDRDQAKVCFGYCQAFLEQPMLKRLVRRETADTIELSNSIAIEVTTNDRRRVRGRTVIAAIFDEVAHWRSENTQNPDKEVYRAVKPAMATMPGALLIGISSPYARRGLLWEKHEAHWGKAGNILVVKAPTWVMNPTVPRNGEVIGEAYDSDPEWAAAEYGAEFRADLESLLRLEAVQACIESGIRERPPSPTHEYTAFCDPSGGSADSMTLGIAHKEGTTVILDALREVRPPFNPEATTLEFADVLRRYRIAKVNGDRYGGEWVTDAFRKAGIYYAPSEKVKSQLYLDLLPLVNATACVLLDDDRLVRQLISLERRTGRGTGRDIIDHPPGAHDDLANAAAGALVMAQIGTFDQEWIREWEKKKKEAFERRARSLV